MGVRQKNAASPGHVRIELPARHPGQQRIHDDPARFKVVMCGRRYGKALALDTPIPTPTGWTTMGALAEGDWVLDEHGAPCRVTFATEVMEGRPCYRMTFSDGETVIADAEHRWLTWDRCARKNVARNTRVNARRVRSWGPPIRNVTPHVRTTEEIRATLTAGRRGDRNHSIPCTAPLVGQDTSWPVAPYVLGVWLGDGSRNGSQFWGNDPDIAECVAACGETVRKGEQKYQWLLNDGRVGGSPESRAHTLTSRLRRLGVLGNKHIPPSSSGRVLPTAWRYCRG